MIHGKCDTFQTELYKRELDNQTVNVRLVGLAKGDFVRIDLTSSDLETINWPIVHSTGMLSTEWSLYCLKIDHCIDQKYFLIKFNFFWFDIYSLNN